MANGLEIDLLDIGFYTKPLDEQLSQFSRILVLPETKTLTPVASKRILAYYQALALRDYLALTRDGLNKSGNNPRSYSNGLHAQYNAGNQISGPGSKSLGELLNICYVDGRVALYYKHETKDGLEEDKTSIKDLDVAAKLSIENTKIKLDDILLRGPREFVDNLRLGTAESGIIVYPNADMSWERIFEIENFAIRCLAAVDQMKEQGLDIELISVKEREQFKTQEENFGPHQATLKINGKRVAIDEPSRGTQEDYLSAIAIAVKVIQGASLTV